MGVFLSFLLEMTHGFLLIAAIPLVAYVIYSLVKVGGIVGARKQLDTLEQNAKSRRNGELKAKPEDGSYADDEWSRTHHIQSSKAMGGKWFRPEPCIIIGFRGLAQAKHKRERELIPSLLRLQIIKGFLLYPFLGHIACILLWWLKGHGGEALANELMTLNPDFLLWHLIAATIISCIELILSIFAYILTQVEASVTAMLSKIRYHLSRELGETRGTEASRFLALMMDMYFDKRDVRSIKSTAWKRQGMTGKDFTAYLIALCEKKQNAPGAVQSIPLTEEGRKLYQDICGTI